MRAAAILAGVPVGGRSPVRLMAVINVSPESFYAGSVRREAGALRAAAQHAAAEGADFIDVGAMSTAPYLNTRVSEDEERRRMTWALDVISRAVTVPLSADTTRAAVAAAALESGARIINDVTGLRGDPAMAAVAARAEGLVVVAAATPRMRHASPARVRGVLAAGLRRAQRAGTAVRHIVLDPGIGFFPGVRPRPEVLNCRLLDQLETLAALGRPLLVGVSRKSFIGTLTGRTDPADRLAGSLAAAAVAVYNGAAIVRAHDVAATRDAIRVAAAMRGA